MNTFPQQTAEIRLADGFPRIGYLTEHREPAENFDADDLALYSFPGDFIAGEGFELWLTAYQATDAEAILEELTVDEE